ncbi:MAG: Clp protease N-terminal domain-containing protein, partial [bacterium]
MDPRKFTEKSLLALEASQNEAIRRQNTQIISIHLLQALVAQENGLIPRLLEKMEIVLPTFQMQLAQRLDALPTLSGSSATQVSGSGELNQVLVSAEEESTKMKDSFISVEHL